MNLEAKASGQSRLVVTLKRKNLSPLPTVKIPRTETPGESGSLVDYVMPQQNSLSTHKHPNENPCVCHSNAVRRNDVVAISRAATFDHRDRHPYSSHFDATDTYAFKQDPLNLNPVAPTRLRPSQRVTVTTPKALEEGRKVKPLAQIEREMIRDAKNRDGATQHTDGQIKESAKETGIKRPKRKGQSKKTPRT